MTCRLMVICIYWYKFITQSEQQQQQQQFKFVASGW